jgi:membrane protease YdiL (CAAX protease family)
MTAPSAPRAEIEVQTAERRGLTVHIPQYSKSRILAVWAAAALPMGALAWIVAPRVASAFNGPGALSRALILCLTAGLIWQFVMVIGIVGFEQGNLRWSTLREALWLRAPKSSRTGRAGGKLWWILVPLIVGTAAEELVPVVAHPGNRDLGLFLSSTVGKTLFHGAWGWFAILLVMFVFNTVLGEELLFRGLLLPRMNGAFGRNDWVANGVLFAAYHLHVPWAIPATLFDTFLVAYPSKRFRSAWIGICVHSTQSVLFTFLILGIVLGKAG